MSWYVQAIKDFWNFSGRSRRREYWMFTLFNVIFAFVIAIIDTIIGINLLTALYELFILIPSLALTVRRLHDIDQPAWWLLIAFVPLAGAIVLFVFSVMPGTEGPNRYGEDPKSING